MVPLLGMLAMVKDNNMIDNGHMMSLNGKLTHYMWLVPEGPWQRGFLLGLQDSGKGSDHKTQVTDLAREQATWWMRHMQAAKEESRIMDPHPMESMKVVNVFPDASEDQPRG